VFDGPWLGRAQERERARHSSCVERCASNYGEEIIMGDRARITQSLLRESARVNSCHTVASNDRNGCAPWKGGTFPAGARPTRQPLQPEATGAGMEVTKCLKPPDSGHEFGNCASVQAATRVNAEQASKRSMCRPTRRKCARRDGKRHHRSLHSRLGLAQGFVARLAHRLPAQVIAMPCSEGPNTA
jgi:hypothetical protein